MLQLSGFSLVVTVLVGIAALAAHVFWIGWWASKLALKIEHLVEKLGEIKQSLDGRYMSLELKVSEDHEMIRQLQTWKSGALLDTLNHVYPKQMVDRMFDELRTELATLNDHVNILLERRRTAREAPPT